MLSNFELQTKYQVTFKQKTAAKKNQNGVLIYENRPYFKRV